MKFLILSCVLLSLGLAARAQQSTAIHVVRAARLIDTKNGRVVNNPIVLINGDRIQAVGRSGEVSIPSGSKVLDLGGATLLPGLIDLHTHLNDEPEFHGVAFHTLSAPRMAITLEPLTVTSSTSSRESKPTVVLTHGCSKLTYQPWKRSSASSHVRSTE